MPPLTVGQIGDILLIANDSPFRLSPDSMGSTLHDNIPRALIVPWTELPSGTAVEASTRPSACSEVQPVDTSNGESYYHATLPIGGRLLHFSRQWETPTTNAWVLQIVRLDLTLEFLSSPPNRFIMFPVSNNPEKRWLMDAQIQHLLDICAIEPVPAEQRGIDSTHSFFWCQRVPGTEGGSWISRP